jgi:outer membrane protein OmpA-like peptidoglycan-associated protein
MCGEQNTCPCAEEDAVKVWTPLLVSLVAAGCATTSAQAGHDGTAQACAMAPTGPAPGRSSVPVNEETWQPIARPLQGTAAGAGIAEMQAQAPTAPAAPEPRRPQEARASEFPDRRSIEALDRIANVVPVEYVKGQPVITLSSDDVFGPGSAVLDPSAEWRLDDIAAALAAQAERTIVIRVYTDAVGDPAESTRLSQRRAEALRDYFVARGVAAGEVRAEGLGPEHPVADDATAIGRAANRRIEIAIVRPLRAGREQRGSRSPAASPCTAHAATSPCMAHAS